MADDQTAPVTDEGAPPQPAPIANSLTPPAPPMLQAPDFFKSLVQSNDPDPSSTMVTVNAAKEINPDAAAKALPVAQATNLPLQTVMRNPETAQRQLDPGIDFFSKLVQENPKTADFINSQDNAAIAHDDIPAMQRVENAIGAIGDFFNPETEAESFAKGVVATPQALNNGVIGLGMIGNAISQGAQSGVTLPQLRFKQLMGTANPGEIAQADALSQQAHTPDTRPYGTDSPDNTPLLDTLLNVAKQGPMLAEIAKQTAIGAMAGTVGGAVIGGGTPAELGTLPAGAAEGGNVGRMHAEFQIFAGQAYDELLQHKDANGNPIDPTVARGMALAIGAANAGLMHLSLGALAKTVPGVQGFLQDKAFAAMLENPSTLDQVKTIAGHYLGGVAAFGGMTGAQQGITDFGGNIAQDLSNGNFKNKSIADIASDVWAATKSGAAMGAVMGLPGSAYGLREAYTAPEAPPAKSIPASLAGAAYIKNVSDAVNSPEFKLRGRSVDGTRSFLQSNMGDEDYFVKPEAVQTFYQSLGPEEKAQLDASMPELADDLNQNLQAGTDMNLGRADYHTFMGHLEPAADLEKNLRLMPDNYSKADIDSMNELIDSFDPSKEMMGAEGEETTKNNFISQLIQNYGQKRAVSGNPDIADKLGDILGQTYNAYSNRYGHIEGAQDLIDKGFQSLIVQRDLPQLEQITNKDDLDLNIDAARSRLKAQLAKDATPGKTDLLGDVKKQRQAQTGPTPVQDYLEGKGKIKTGSSAAKDLKEVGVTSKTRPKLFSSKGSVESLDNISLDDAQNALGHLMGVEAEPTDSTDTEPSYVGKDWLTNAIHDETLGKGAKDDKAIQKEQQGAYLDELTHHIDMSGADLLNDSTPKIKKALNDHLDQMRSAMDEGGGETFNQSSEGGGEGPIRRGSLKYYADGRAVMTLFEKENFSTIIHELGHLNWLVLSRIAGLPGGEDAAADVAAVRAFVGAEDGADLSEAQHEKIADAFVKYVETGDAPSAPLQSAFQRFKTLLTHLYRRIKDQLPDITPEVKGVFDRMVATDDQIEQMRNAPEYQLDPAYKEFMSPADYARAQRNVERMLGQAKDKLLAAALREYRKQYSEEYKNQRAAIHADTTESVNSEKVYQTIDRIKEAGGLSRKSLTNLKGKEILKYLPKNKDRVLAKGKGGVDVGKMAGLTGYEDGHDLTDALMNAEPRADRIDRLTDVEMLQRHGDMMHDGTMEREAEIKAHNEYRAQFLGMELKALADKAKILAPSREAVKARAAKYMGEMQVRKIRPDIHKQAEVSAARRVGRFLATKNYQKAAEAKAQELFNHHLYKMANEAKADIDKTQKSWRRLLNKTDEQITQKRVVTDANGEQIKVRRDIDYVYAARAILAKYGLGRSDYDFYGWQKNMARENPDLADQINQAISMWDDPPPATQRQIRNGKYAGNTVTTPGWRYLSLDEFHGLKDAVNNLIEVGNKQNELNIDGKPVALETAVQEAGDQLASHGQSGVASGYGGTLGKMDHTKWTILSAKAQGRRIGHWIESVDGGPAGPMRKYIWNPVKDALGKYRDAERDMMAKVKDALSPHRDRLLGEPILAPELSSDEAPNGFKFDNKGHLLGMLAHTGNESNFYKLINGYGWDEDAFHSFVERMHAQGVLTKNDYDLVQNLWDIADELKPQAQKAHKDMYGYRFDEVTASPVNTPFGQYRGGYWPAVVDRNVSEDAAMRADKDMISTGGQTHMFPSSGRGFTKSRDDLYAGPLEMKLDLLPSHIDKVLRFIHVEPAIKDVAKILMNRDFRDTAFKADRTLVTEMLIPWLQRSARQMTESPVEAKSWKAVNKAAHWLRGQIGVLTFMGSIPNMFVHLGSIGITGHDAGWDRVGESMMQILKNPVDTVGMIHDLSPEMRNRGMVGEIRDTAQISRMLTDRNLYTKVNDFSKDNAYVLQKMVWTSLDHIGWLAAFNKAMEGDVQGIESGDQLNAVRHADTSVIKAQGSHNAEDISQLEFQSHAAKLLQFFYGYFNNAGNVLMTEGAKIANSDSGGGAKAASAGYLFFTHVVIASVIAELVAGGLRGAVPAQQDYKTKPAWMLAMGEYLGGGAVHYLGGMVPGLDAVIDGAVSALTGRPYSDTITLSPALIAVQNVFKEVPALYKAMFQHGSKEAALRDVIGGAGGLAFPAVGAVKRPLLYAAGVADHKIHPKIGLDVARGIIGGPRPGNMPQR